MARISEWRKLPVALTELCLGTTLRCGQSFRWRHSDEDNIWTCTLRGRIVQLTQDISPSSPSPEYIRYRSIWPAPPKSKRKPTISTPIKAPPTPPSSIPPSSSTNSDDGDDSEAERSQACGEEMIDDTYDLLHHYLNLTPNLSSLYSFWSKSDKNFARKAPKFTGVRILKQDAWEALVGFICSSNNNIARISQMVEKLCLHYGPYIGTINGKRYHDFPTPLALTGDGIEAHLRELGFGYRAKFIAKTAKIIAFEREAGWLDSLRNPESPAYSHLSSSSSPKPTASAGEMAPEGREGYLTAHAALLELQGVGPKVADCVCLMGLGWGEAVPVDTHVWQIAQRDYKLGKGKNTSMTKAAYDMVANHFRKLWGKEAGWAHSVLFTADLRVFAERLVVKKEVVKIEDEEGGGRDGEDSMKVVEEVTEVKTAVKREWDDDVEMKKPVVQIDQLTVSSSERVKRRRRGVKSN